MTRARARGVAALALVLAALACGSCASSPRGGADGASRVSLSRPVGARGAHQQIVRALTAADKAAVVARFRERNGASWAVTLGAGGAPDDVDAIRGNVRRAKDEAPVRAPATEITEASAIAEGEAFLVKNADLLGFTEEDVPSLDLAAGPARTTTYGVFVVHARGKTPMRAYEGFASVASAIDVLLYLGEDGRVRYFVNLTRAHPRLVLDTTPLLGPDDPRVLRNVVGRPLFVVVDDPSTPGLRVRELRRVQLGPADASDVRAVRLTIHVSPGPRVAYVSYFLAYVVDVVKQGQEFRFVVDADTGDVLEDASVPVVSAGTGADLRP